MKTLALAVVFCVAVVTSCKKKDETGPAAGSGSAPAMAGSGSGSAPTMAGSGSATAPAAGSGSAIAAGSGSAADPGSAAGSGSGSASAAAAGSGSAAAPTDGKNWDCKKLCKQAHACKDKNFASERECDDDCTRVMKDTTGKYTNGSIQGVPFYSCANKATDCAALTACTPGAK